MTRTTIQAAFCGFMMFAGVATTAHAQGMVPEGYFYASDIPKKIFYVTAVQAVPDRKWSGPNYFAGFARQKGWDTKQISKYSGSLHYISKASAFFEKQDRKTYQDRIERMRGVGYTIVSIPMPTPVSLNIKPGQAVAK